jgi:hypothetical protein
LPLTPREGHDCRGLLAVAAAYFGRRDFAWAAGGLTPEVIWMLGRGGIERFDGLDPAPPDRAPSRHFQDAGCVVMRNEWAPDATRVIFDVGPLWRGDCRGHGHADLLSLQLAVGCEAWLVDSGTYCYTSEPAWRRHFRGTAAHNTITIDGCGQAEPVGPFGWVKNAGARLRTWRTDATSDYADADHLAFADLPDPVRHRRRVLFIKPDVLVVVDDVYGRAQHLVQTRWHWSRPVEARDDGWFVGTGPGGSLWLKTFSAVPPATRLACGGENPIEGWLSDDYGHKRPAPVLVTTVEAQLPLRFVTVIVPQLARGRDLGGHASLGPDGLLRSIEFEGRPLVVEIDDADVLFRRS